MLSSHQMDSSVRLPSFGYTTGVLCRKKCNVEKCTEHDPSFINTNQKSYFEENKRIH